MLKSLGTSLRELPKKLCRPADDPDRQAQEDDEEERLQAVVVHPAGQELVEDAGLEERHQGHQEPALAVEQRPARPDQSQDGGEMEDRAEGQAPKTQARIEADAEAEGCTAGQEKDVEGSGPVEVLAVGRIAARAERRPSASSCCSSSGQISSD